MIRAPEGAPISWSPGLTRPAMSWLCERRSPFGLQVDLDVGLVGPLTKRREVVADQPIEVVRRRRAHVELEIDDVGLGRQTVARASRVTRAVSSSVVPSGMSTITWNSLLLSKGSIFTRTSLKNTSEQAASSRSSHGGEEDGAALASPGSAAS